MKIKTAYLKNKEYLNTIFSLRVPKQYIFIEKNINAERLPKKCNDKKRFKG